MTESVYSAGSSPTTCPQRCKAAVDCPESYRFAEFDLCDFVTFTLAGIAFALCLYMEVGA